MIRNTTEQKAAYVRGLETERAGYEAQGKADRAKEVEAEIARTTGKPSDAAERRPRGQGGQTRGA